MVRYFCDRCDAEVESHQDLTSFTSEAGDGVSSTSWRTKRDLCPKCLEEVKELVGKFFIRPQANRRAK